MFRIMPKVYRDEPIQRSFENAKAMVDVSVRTMRFEFPVTAAMSGFEQASIRRIPYLMDPTNQRTMSIWKRGSLVVDTTLYAQNTSPTINVYAAKKDQAAVLLVSQPCVVAAGAAVYRIFSTMVPNVDLTGYDALGVACVVGSAPASADRYTITVQLTFHPFEAQV